VFLPFVLKIFFMKLLFILMLCPFTLLAQRLILPLNIKMLALGDSYTIGQGVHATELWPVQLMDSLAKRGFSTNAPRIIAQTGWRTDNLINAIAGLQLQSQDFNLVSLLIGVNNQYQFQPFSKYEREFPQLLDSAIRFARGDASHVFVVSIPDYAFTPFGERSGSQAFISNQIDQYNAFNRQMADLYGIQYFEITAISRLGIQQPALVANDGLHPSGLQYSKWVQKIMNYVDSLALGVQSKSIFRTNELLLRNQGNQKLVYEWKHKPKPNSILLITDMNGRELKIIEVKNQQGEINISQLKSGMYFAKIQNSTNPVYRFIKH